MIIEQIDKTSFDLNSLKDENSEFYFVDVSANGNTMQLYSLDAMAMWGIINRLKDDSVGLVKIMR